VEVVVLVAGDGITMPLLALLSVVLVMSTQVTCLPTWGLLGLLSALCLPTLSLLMRPFLAPSWRDLLHSPSRSVGISTLEHVPSPAVSASTDVLNATSHILPCLSFLQTLIFLLFLLFQCPLLYLLPSL